MDKEIKCKDCGKKVIVKVNARFPRKYCDKCSAQRKEAYENIDQVSIEDCED